MVLQNLTLRVPAELYEQIRERAARLKHSIEDETVNILASAMPIDDSLPNELLEEVDHLSLLNDEQLWAAARSKLSADLAKDIESLNYKQQSTGLTASERERRDEGLRECDRIMLIRAEAAALLKERGHDISELMPPS